jgi:excinuclease ABC subunit A
VETALKWGEGTLLLLQQPGEGAADPSAWTESLHSNRNYSPATGESFDTPTPKHFSFNSPLGACPVCHGLGQKMVFDEHLVVPDVDKSLEKGAVLPWRRGNKRMLVYYKALLRGMAKHYGQSLETPWKDLPEDFRTKLLRGTGAEEITFTFFRGGTPTQAQKSFEGIIPNLERLYVESESEFTKNRLKTFMNPQPCDACGGRRLKPEILAVTLGGNEASARFKSGPSTPPGLSIMDVCGQLFRGTEAERFPAKNRRGSHSRNSRPPRFSQKCRARLSHSGPRERHVERRRGAAHPAGHANRRGTGRRALYT